MFCHFGVGEDDVGVALQGVVVIFGKVVAGFGGDEQLFGLFYEGVNGRLGQGFFFCVNGFVHGDDELGDGVQPGEPRVAGEEF